jgi:hypothetical protein
MVSHTTQSKILRSQKLSLFPITPVQSLLVLTPTRAQRSGARARARARIAGA